MQGGAPGRLYYPQRGGHVEASGEWPGALETRALISAGQFGKGTCVCECVCAHTCVHVQCVCTCVCMSAYVYMCMRVCVHVCTYVCMYMRMYVCVCMHV